MTWLLAIGAVAALLMAFAAWLIVRPVLGPGIPWPAFGGTAVAILVTAGVGLVLQVGTLDYFLGVALGTLPVLVLLLATADGSGADRLARWVLVLVWAGILFPFAVIVPAFVSSRCTALECTIEDFGAALALLVSPAALALLAWLPAEVGMPRERARGTWRSVLGPVALLWLGFAVWLAHLEGAFDEYVPRILFAATVAPLAGGLAWLAVDALRGRGPTSGRSLAYGVVAGMVAIAPGAVSVSFPWSIVVGALAGAIGALVYSARGVTAAGPATRWAVTVLAATMIGYFAPPVSGDTVGLFFSGRIGGLIPPATAFLVVVLVSLLVSAPLWILLRRHASRTAQKLR